MHSLVSLINNVATAIDRNQIAAGVFIDLSKAFDTLDHEILFTKLQHYGIKGVALQWIKSYFCNREQFVQVRLLLLLYLHYKLLQSFTIIIK
jgi:hypothetical protein